MSHSGTPNEPSIRKYAILKEDDEFAGYEYTLVFREPGDTTWFTYLKGLDLENANRIKNAFNAKEEAA